MKKIFAVIIIGILCLSMFSILAPKIKGQIITASNSTLFIVSGSGTFSSVSATSLTITVSPGQALSGTVMLDADNEIPSYAVVPLIGTPSWGNDSTSWWLIDSWLPVGSSTWTTDVQLSAPLQAGTYYVIFAFRGELTGDQVASATNWPVGYDVWNDGNDIAEFNATQIAQAQQNGVTVDNWLYTNGYWATYVPADAITVIVASSDYVGLSTPAINGLQVDFNGGASPGSQVTYIQWSWGDGSVDKGWFPHAHTYASSGTYEVTVTAYYNDGSSASASAMVSVAPGILSGGDSLTITAGAGGSVSYVASVGSGTLSSGSSMTLYLAFADDLSLNANPNSGYSFQSWTATSGITGLGGSPVATTSSDIDVVVIGNSNIAANFASAQASSLSVNIEQNPAITQNVVPFSMTFTAVAYGGTAPYGISWTITSASGNSYVTGNPFTYTFKYAGAYTVSVTVTDSKSNTATNSIQIEALGSSYIATFLASSGDATLSGTPSITLEENNQLGQGIIALGFSTFSFETDIKINWGGILLPDLVASFLGFSYPWYTIVVTDEFGNSFQVPSPIQLSFSDTTNITANFPLYQQLDNLVPPGVSTLYTFAANPATSQALSMDLISAVFAAIHIGIPSGSVLENLLVGVASDLADSMTTDIVQKLVSGDSTLVAQVLPGILKEMENDLNLYASIAGTLAETLADGANEAASLAASLGDFLFDMISLTATLVRGNLWDDYILTSATSLLSVVVDPNETVNAILSTPQGEVGYANGVWENTGNLTGFVHSDITNNTYGFAIPISVKDYNANLTISSPNGEAIPFAAVVKWENQTTELGGTVQAYEANSFQLSFVNEALSITCTITFNQLGVSSDYSGTVLVVDGASYDAGVLPVSFIWPAGSTHTFAFQSPLVISSGAKEYDWNSTSGLSTSQSDSINATASGSITANYATLVHDVAVTNVTADRTWVYKGNTVNINVTVWDNGDFPENITVTVYYNITGGNVAGVQNVTMLSGQNETLTFAWNTASVPVCYTNYTLTAVATILADYTPADNTLADGNITVRFMGDITGTGAVDISDISIAAAAFGSHLGMPNWNPAADVNGDGVVDIMDIALIASNFGQHYP
jgi:hypothetical protein